MIAVHQQPAHAKSRPPSGALRWINCPGSVNVVPLYPNDEGAAALRGTDAHKQLELGILFGLKPNTDDPDNDLNVMDVLDWVEERRTTKFGPDCKVYAEQRYDIAETGEFGTCDITFVSNEAIEIADYKNGYIYTDAYEQLMLYLIGAIQKFGPRKQYYITVLQPNYNHVEGPYRTLSVTPENLEIFRISVIEAVQSNSFNAGEWCKKSYCPHRGACQTFLTWCETTGADAYYVHEINAMDDDRLAEALDHAEVLQGIRDEYRKEAMRRIMQHNRDIRGYKMVKSRQQRDFAGEKGRSACLAALLDIGYGPDDLQEKSTYTVGEITLTQTTALTVAGVERMVKQKYKHFKRGTWKQIWEQYFQPHIRNFSSSLTLERAIDGRPAQRPGSEFGSITGQLSFPQVSQV